MEVGPPKGKGAPAGEPNAMAAGASKYLANLPSRGLFSSAALSSNLGGVRVYVCVHDTSPPGEQLIKTNQTNILIRSLTLKKQKGESGAKDIKVKVAAENTNGKRSAERPVEARTSAKRANTTSSTGISRQEGSSSRSTEEFHNLTVERLRALLKERALSTKGKKDELISRLKENGRGEK